MTTLSSTEYKALADFRFALRQFMAFSETAAQKNGVTPQQYQALLAIKAHQGPEAMTIKELAERLLLQPNSAFELTDRLETAGLIARSRSPTDRRRTLLQLTGKADQLITDMAESHREELRRLGPALTNGLKGILEGAARAQEHEPQEGDG